MTLLRQAKYLQALIKFRDALTCSRKASNRQGEGTALNNIGGIYDSLGQYEEARKYYDQALAIRREIGDRAGEGGSLNNIGGIYNSLGQYQEALKYYQPALAIAREIGDRAGEGRSLNNIGLIYDRLGQYQEALQYYQQALSIAQEIGDRAGEGVNLNNIGGIYSSLGQYREALKYYQQALAINRDIGDRAGEAITLASMGYLYERQGQLDQALTFYRQAIDVRESMHALATVEEFKTALAAQSADVHQLTILLLLKLNRPAEAFHLAERARARTLLDQLGNARVNPTATDNPGLAQQEEQLRGAIQALEKELQAEWAKPQDQRNNEVIRSVTTQLETQRSEYARVLQTLKLYNPEYASLVTVNPLTLTETQKILTNTTLVEYFVTVSQTVAFVVTQNDFRAVQVTVTEDNLAKAVQDLYAFPSLEGVPAPLKTLQQFPLQQFQV